MRFAAPSRGLRGDGSESASNVRVALGRCDAPHQPYLYLGHDHLGDAAAFSVRLDAGCVWYAT